MKTQHHFLALIPLLSLLSIAPMEWSEKSSRHPASIIEERLKEFPKYEAKVKSVVKSREISPSLDLDFFSENGQKIETQIKELRASFKADEKDTDKIAIQKDELDCLIREMVEFEADYTALVEKKAFTEPGDKIAAGTIKEMKTVLESLLIDQEENDRLNLKEETPVVAEEPKEETKIEETKPEVASETEKTEDCVSCQMEEKNKILTQQVADMLKQQQQILDSMTQMNQNLTQLLAQQQANQSNNYWSELLGRAYLGYGPMALNGLSQAPVTNNYYQYGSQPHQQNLAEGMSTQNTQQFQMPQPQYPMLQQQLPMMMDQRYSNQPIYYGDFGPQNFQFNFGGTNNILPLMIQSA